MKKAKSKVNLQTKQNYESHKDEQEGNFPPSQTKPGQALSLETLLSRSNTNQEYPVFRVEYDNEEFEMPDLSGLDEMDRIDYMRNLKEQILEAQKTLIANNKKRHERLKQYTDAANKSIQSDEKVLTQRTNAETIRLENGGREPANDVTPK